jgi:hypothetical protein
VVYGLSSDADRRRVAGGERAEAAQSLVWLSLYRQAMTRRDLYASLSLEAAEVDRAVENLTREGRVREVSGKLRADTFVVPVGSTKGWEIAVFDHFSAVARAIAAKLRRGAPQSEEEDVTGGATLTFELYAGHPLRSEVRGLLRRVRGEVNELWSRVGEHNDGHPIAETDKELVTFYFGQNADEASSDEREQG